MNPLRIRRRAFLRSIGAGVGMLPVLETDFVRAAEPRKRLVIVYKSNGTVFENFWPAQPGPLTTLPSITAPLLPYKDRLLMLGAVDLRAHAEDPNYGGYMGHDANIALMTGTKTRSKDGNTAVGSPSVDQVIADALLARGVALPRKSLELGVLIPAGDDQHYRISYRGANAANAPQNDPWKLADDLFGGAAGTPSQAAGPSAADELRRKRRKSVLDLVGRDLERYAKNLGGGDRQKVQAHLDSVREIERQLTTITTPTDGGASCGKPALPAKTGTNGWLADDVKNYPALAKAQMDLLAAALCADVTRVATFMLTDCFGTNLVFHWLAQSAGAGIVNRNYHDMTHNFPKTDEERGYKVAVETWFMQQYAYLVGLLAGTPEGGGSVLDQSAVVLVDPMQNGSFHNVMGAPFVIAGSCGGYFKTGRYLKLGEFGPASWDASYKYTPHNGVLAALCNAMGVPRETFGDPTYGGEPAGLRG